jgi:hemoglobin/transferrin/lactoferrin receptor protein
MACTLGLMAWQARSAESADIHPLDTVTVTATKQPRSVGDIAATVSVIDADDIERRNAATLKDLVRYEPGVSVRHDGSRFGMGSLTIRGLEGNRVAMEVDGTPIADAFAIGSFSNAGRDAIDLEILKQVEIVRGPSSSLHGSDALAGVVGFITRDPLDLLDAEERGSMRARLGYDGVDQRWQSSATLAGRMDAWSGLLLVTHQEGHERRSGGNVDHADATRTLANPQDSERQSLLGKLLFDINDQQQLKLTLDAMRSDVTTKVWSARRSQPSGPSVVRTDDLSGFDATARDRIAFDYSLRSSGGFDEVQVKLYRQDSDVVQDTTELRTSIAASGAQSPQRRDRRFDFQQDTNGLEVTALRSVIWGETQHDWLIGGEWQRTDSAQLRDGLQTNLLTGVSTPIIGPDAFPVRDFPLSSTRELSFYVQDAISWGEGRFEVLPSLRWDEIRLDAKADAIFTADNPGVAIENVAHDKLSAKLAARYRFDDHWSLHAQWAQGFRAPPYSDINVGFTNLQFGYTARPNPELRPEESDGYEVGLRLRGDTGFATLTVYDNDYRDFIESFVNLGVDPSTGLMVFQSQNIADVGIRGVELRGSLAGDAIHTAWAGWRFDLALAQARGRDRTRDAALTSVDPARATLGATYTSASGRWDVEAVASGVRRQDRTDDRFGAAFKAPGHAVFDLIGQWRMSDRLTLSTSVLNVFDRHYWDWADVRGRLANDTTIDRYSAPGRTANLGLTVEI